MKYCKDFGGLYRRNEQNMTIRERIEQIEAEISAIDQEFEKPEIATNSAKLGELSKKREELSSKLSALYEAWEDLLA